MGFSFSKVGGGPKKEEGAATEGPRAANERGCTDILCLLTFVLYWIGMLIIMSVSVRYGDINAIKYGKDYRGNRCGVGDFVNMSKTFYPRIDLDLFEQKQFLIDRKPWLVRLYGLCTPHCVDPSSVDIKNAQIEDAVKRANYNWNDQSTTIQDRAVDWYTILPEISILNRCMPYTNEDQEIRSYCYRPTCNEMGVECALEGSGDGDSWELLQKYTQAFRDKCIVKKTISAGNEFENYHASYLQTYVTGQLGGFISFMESINESRTEIAVTSLLFCSVICFIWLLLVGRFAKVVVYTMIFAMFALLLSIVGLTFTYSCFIDTSSYDCAAAAAKTTTYAGVTLENTNVYRGAFFVSTIIFIIFLLSMIYLKKAITTCVAIVREASVVVGAMPTLFALPIISTSVSVCFFLYFLYIGAYIATSYEETYAYFDTTSVSAYTNAVNADGTRGMYFLMIYHLLGSLWALSFIVGVSSLTIAGAVASWFFFRDNKERYPKMPVVSSAYTTCRFHLGTVAFGSLLVALCQLLRIILEWVDQQTRSLQQGNVFARMTLKCVKCCMWCLEKFLKFITGYAYIYTAIEGMSFCTAAKSTFVLIMKYPAQVYINHLVQMMLKLLMSVTVPFACGLICYFWVEGGNKPDGMYCAVIPIGCSFFIPRLFATVYEVVIESVFVCSFRDRDAYGARHTPASIRKAFGLDGKVTEENEPLKPASSTAKAAPAPITRVNTFVAT